jgi:hypothetical protein
MNRDGYTSATRQPSLGDTLNASIDMTSTVKSHDDRGGPRVPLASCFVGMGEDDSSHRKRWSP